jgi:hypothetical protein
VRLGAALGIFAILDVLLGGVLVGLVASRGPVEVCTTWILGIKDVLVFAQDLVTSPEQAVVLVLAGLVASAGVLVSTGYGVGRFLLHLESR